MGKIFASYSIDKGSIRRLYKEFKILNSGRSKMASGTKPQTF
jgi:hypothetical protein